MLRPNTIRILFSLFFALFVSALFIQPAPAFAADYRSYADSAASRLYNQYSFSTGLWDGRCSGGDFGPCWWQSANQLTTMIDYMTRGGSNDYTSIISNTFDKNRNRYDGNFNNDFADDTGWWGLAWLRAYDKTNDSRYLNMAKLNADHMQTFWDTNTCGGGIWWNSDRNYKNAITIELYIELNAAYYNRSGNSTYLTRAQTGWNWFVNSGMINGSNLVNDGLNSSCANNNGTLWTYNQGVVLGAAAELHRATNNGTYLDRAQQIANATMNTLVHGQTGALRENGCESGDCGNDGALFKGIFMRNLYELNVRRFNQANQNFMTLNADSIWANTRSGDNFGLFWSGPYTGTDANRQSSALDALNGAIQYTSGGSTTGNIGLNRPTAVSGQCGSNESGAQAVDGSTSSKWCAGLSGGVAWVRVDIGSNNTHTTNGFTVRHAGAGGENSGYNTRDFKIQGSSDASTWYDLVTVNGNTSNTTNHSISNVGFRYYRLWITNPQTNSQYIAARIYEFEVLGYQN